MLRTTLLITALLSLAPGALADSLPHASPWQFSAREAPATQMAPGAGQPSLLLTKKWDELSRDEKRKVKEAEERYKQLPKDEKQKLREQWEKMPEKQKKKYKLEREYR